VSTDGSGYDSVAVVAHSLGSVISDDLLRFLKAGELASDLIVFRTRTQPLSVAAAST
jgi:hypothetical protein